MAKRGPKKAKAERGKIVSDPARVLPAPDTTKTAQERLEEHIESAVTPEGRAMVRLTGEAAPRFNPSRRMVESDESGGLRFAQVPELVQTTPGTRVIGPGITSRVASLLEGAHGARGMGFAARRAEDMYMYEQMLTTMMKPEAGVVPPMSRTRMSERRNTGMIPPPGRGESEVKTWTDPSIIMSEEEKQAVLERKKKDSAE